MTIALQKRLNSIVEDLYRRAHAGPPQEFDGIVCDRPEDAELVFSAPDLFHKHFGNVGWLGKSRFNTDGDLWRSRRLLTHSFLNAGARGEMVERIEQIYATRFGALPDATIDALQSAINLAATETFLTIFGCTTPPERIANFLVGMRPLLLELQASGWIALAEPDMHALQMRAQLSIEKFENVLLEDVETSALLTRIAENVEGGTRRDATEELLIGALAATESTTATMMMLIDRLGVNQNVQERIREERSSHSSSQIYASCFIKETLRYFPPIPFVSRTATADTEVNKHTIRRGQSFIVSIIGIHHDSRHWNAPHIFDSARSEFIDDGYDRKSFVPFLRGPRTCGGMRIAEIELASALNAFIDRFRSINSEPGISIDYSLVLRPKPTKTLHIERV